MRLPKKGERGFTLIELLIVVAILGVLAAVVIPNVQRFIGAGEEEAAETELSTIQTAVVAMMVDNQVSELAPITTGRTNDMSGFPDISTDDPVRGAWTTQGAIGEVPGYVLFGNQVIVDADDDGWVSVESGDGFKLVNYVAVETTAYWYTITADGTVTQYLNPTPTP